MWIRRPFCVRPFPFEYGSLKRGRFLAAAGGGSLRFFLPASAEDGRRSGFPAERIPPRTAPADFSSDLLHPAVHSCEVIGRGLAAQIRKIRMQS